MLASEAELGSELIGIVSSSVMQDDAGFSCTSLNFPPPPGIPAGGRTGIFSGDASDRDRWDQSAAMSVRKQLPLGIQWDQTVALMQKQFVGCFRSIVAVIKGFLLFFSFFLCRFLTTQVSSATSCIPKSGMV